MIGWKAIKTTLDTCATVAMISMAVFVMTQYRFRATGAKPANQADAPQLVGTTIARADFDKAERKGSDMAPVVIMEFSDFQCPYCGEYASNTYAELDRALVRGGEVEYMFRHLPLTSLHPVAMKAAQVAECAAEQGRFWEMHDLLFASQPQLKADTLSDLGRTIGLDALALDRCMTKGTPSRVSEDLKMAARLGIAGTPYFVIGERLPNGDLLVTATVSGAQDLAAFTKAVAASRL